jgi:hypothetical protein
MPPEAVYAIEHADHLCDVRYISLDREAIFLETLPRQSPIWFERLCTVNSESTHDEIQLLARYCKRRMIPMQNERGVDCYHYLAFEYAQELLCNGRSEWGWVTTNAFGVDTVMRFGRGGDPELVVRPHIRDWTPFGPWHDTVTTNVYIQETMVPPACTLSVSGCDPRHAECNWRECLGEVPADVIMHGVFEVRLDDINRIIHESSKPVIALSHCMPPTYIPKEWLEKEFAKAKIVH